MRMQGKSVASAKRRVPTGENLPSIVGKIVGPKRKSRYGIPLKHGGVVGGVRSPTYFSWSCMRDRCNNPNKYGYCWYGGKGISICDRWSDFSNFLSDMGERPEDCTLDRIDPYGNYEPSNCRWATPSEQTENRRPRNKKSGTVSDAAPDCC